MRRSLRLTTVIPILGFLLMIGCLSCGGNFFSTSYQSTVAYFNTYYNAKKTFDDALQEIEKSKPETLKTNVFASFAIPQTARNKLLSVIERCSKIIQFYPQSNLVDDALLMIGKSYQHLNELFPANKKFVELVTNFPNSDLRFEANLSLARTHYLSQREEEALAVLNELAQESLREEEDEIALGALLLRGQIYLDKQDYPRAISDYASALEISGDSRLLAPGAYQLARCYELQGNAETASKAYLKVVDFGPEFLLGYQSRLRAAVMNSKIGNFSGAIGLLEDLRGEPLSPENRSVVEFEMGNVHQAQEAYQKALDQYSLVDSLYKRTDAAAKSYFQSGVIYETKFFDFGRAKILYDKAKTESPQSEVTPAAMRKSEIFGRYFVHRTELQKYDSLLHVTIHPDSLPPVSLDTMRHKRAVSQFALGVLFFIDLNRADSAAYWLKTLLNEYPESRYSPQTLYALAEVYRSTNDTAQVDSIYQILLSRYPDSEYAHNITKLFGPPLPSTVPDSAEILYRDAEKLLESGKAESAVRGFKRIAKSYHGMFGVKARYAAGWVYENVLNNNDSALAHYRLLIQEQPSSVYADRVRAKLAMRDNPESNGATQSKTPAGGPEKESPKQNNEERDTVPKKETRTEPKDNTDPKKE